MENVSNAGSLKFEHLLPQALTPKPTMIQVSVNNTVMELWAQSTLRDNILLA